MTERIYPPPKRRLVTILLTAAAFVGSWSAPGCTRSQSGQDNKTIGDAKQRLAAPEYLRAVFDRYHNAQSYRDAGVVRLSYQTDGKQQSESAPLSVFLSGSSLYLEAYDLRLLTDRKKLNAWITDPTTNNFDSQVLVQKMATQRPTLGDLLRDPILTEHLSAGLAGPPPQLDWLFADEPMKNLFQSGNRIEYLQDVERDGRKHVVISVSTQDEKYRFMIESLTSVIRQVDFPLPAANAPGFDAKLSLILDGATFVAPKESPTIDSLPRDARQVRRFVPLPPFPPSKALGRQPKPLKATDRAGKTLVTQNGSDRDATVVLQASKQLAPNLVAEFAVWYRAIPQKTKARLRVIVSSNDPNVSALLERYSIPVVTHDFRESISDSSGWNLLILDRKGQIAWLQSLRSSSELSALGPIIGDVLEGIDVPSRLRQQSRTDVAAYRKALAAAQIPPAN